MTGNARAVFLDRDGVINKLVERDGRLVGPRRLQDFHLYEDVAPAAREFRKLGYMVFVVSNQPDIARGSLDPRELDAMTQVVQGALVADEVVYCPHDDADQCACRKPKSGMLLELAERWGLALGRSYMVGDTWRDMEAGRGAGCTTILVERATPADIEADLRASGLMDAVSAVRSHSNS